MRKIVAIARKDALIRFSSRSELLFFLILPVAFTYILGGGLNGGGNEDQRVPLPIVDEDRSKLAADLLAVLRASDAVQPEVMARTEAERRFTDQAATMFLTIPAGFEAALLAGKPAELALRTAPNTTDAVVEQAIRAAAGAITSALVAAQRSVEAAERIQPFESAAERAAWEAQSRERARELLASAPKRVTVTQPAGSAMAWRGGFDNTAYQSAGQLVTWVFIPFLGMSGLFAFERTLGTLRRLFTMPTSRATYLLGTIAGQLSVGIVQMLLLTVFGAVVMGLNWGHAPGALAVMLVSFGLASLALGTMLGTFVKTEGQATGLSIMLGMVLALLGGCWFPLEIFPETARLAARALPTNWAMQGFVDIVMRGRGLADVLPEAGALLAFAAAFFAIGVWRFRFE